MNRGIHELFYNAGKRYIYRSYRLRNENDSIHSTSADNIPGNIEEEIEYYEKRKKSFKKY